MNCDDPSVIKDFVIESQEHLSDVEAMLLSLEGQSDNIDVAVVNKVFRAIHSIKGAAGFMGLTVLETMSHRAEEVLNCLRNRSLSPTSDVINCLLKSVDQLKHLLEHIETSDSIDISAPVSALEKLIPSRFPPKNGKPDTIPTQVAPVQSQNTQPAGETAKTPSKRVARKRQATLSPTAGTPQPISGPLETLEHVTNELQGLNGTVPGVTGFTQSAKPEASVAATTVPSAEESQNANSNPAVGNPTETLSTSFQDTTIRVDVALLDRLMTRVGELVLARNRILQVTSSLGDAELTSASQRLNLITSELQESVMKTRMQPIGNIWSKFPRLVRDLASVCGKEVRIEMEGKDTELDKTIIEAIKDPLTHLVRNSVDHGIETPALRQTRGKPAEGCLKLRAFHEGGQVNIEITDDGAGLNLERIAAKAIERSLVTQEQISRMDTRELTRLIFHPGLSTAEVVSNVSGRGVGMDVVKTNIEKLGGTIDIRFIPGQSTTIAIKIPLTLAIIPALIVANDQHRFAIPQVNLLELVRLEGQNAYDGIERVQGAPVYRLRGQLLPLVYLSQVLKTSDTTLTNDSINIVVLKADGRQFGLVVDRVNDTEEIVVKPLSSQLKGVAAYSGATIMGDGRVALILDVLGIANLAGITQKSRANQDAEVQRSKATDSGAQSLLILGTRDQRRVALPISQVARLETIFVDDIEYANCQEVVQYRGQILPLIRLASALGLNESGLDEYPTCEDGTLKVVVYDHQGQCYGLVVNRIVDILTCNSAITPMTQRPGFKGSAVIQEHVTDLVDLPALMQQILATGYTATQEVLT